MIFVHPGSRIQKQQQKRGMKNNVSYLFCSHKYREIKKNVIVEKNFQRIIGLFAQKLSLSSQKCRFGIRKKHIPDPGSKGQRIPDPDPQHWLWRQIRSNHLLKLFEIVRSGPDDILLFQEFVGPCKVYAVL